MVNGVPAAIVEHKNPTDAGAIERGVAQLRRYQAETPELLAAPQLFNEELCKSARGSLIVSSMEVR